MGLTLGELIAELKKVPGELSIKIAAPMDLVPTEVHSYRGYYSDLAIDFECSYSTKTVKEFLPTLEEAVGKTFEGYKGGDFHMPAATPIWVSRYGQASGALVRGVSHDKHTCWIELEMEHW